MQNRTVQIFLVVLCAGAFLLACRTTDLIAALQASPTPAQLHVTRAALRPTFTPIPSDTLVPPPTDTPVPTDTEVPTDVPVPTDTAEPTEVPPTDVPIPTDTEVPTETPKPSATLAPNFPWEVSSGPDCTIGNNGASTVTGVITAHDKGAVGQHVQASAGPGGEPISDQPAASDKDGNYKVTLICGGTGCNGDFYLWMVDPQNHQISPFVKFHFSSTCRKGTLNFRKK